MRNDKKEKHDDQDWTAGLLKAILVPAIVGLIAIVVWLISWPTRRAGEGRLGRYPVLPAQDVPL